MTTVSLEIQELLTLKDLEIQEAQYEQNFGFPPFNISTWNPSEDFLNLNLLNKVQLNSSDFIHYLYSYELNPYKLDCVKSRLGFSDNKGMLITNSGTSAISLVTAVLYQLGLKRILVISPTYYSVLYNCTQLQMDIKEIHMIHNENGYFLPRHEIEKSLTHVDAIWLTNPIYNTGVGYSDEDKSYLEKVVLPSKFLICDECFALTGNELSYAFSKHVNYIGIYDPMKQIMINGLKFACIVFDEKYQHLFNDWSDIICGSLSYSTIQGIDFFCKSSFFDLADTVNAVNKATREKLNKIIKRYSQCFLDKNCSGHMQMCYFPTIEHNCFRKVCHLKDFIWSTGISLIPGDRFHFNPNDGFCFRINLARDCNFFFDAIYRTLDYLDSIENRLK